MLILILIYGSYPQPRSAYMVLSSYTNTNHN